MIPTMLLFGLVLGHWWKTCLVIATLSWPCFCGPRTSSSHPMTSSERPASLP